MMAGRRPNQFINVNNESSLFEKFSLTTNHILRKRRAMLKKRNVIFPTFFSIKLTLFSIKSTLISIKSTLLPIKSTLFSTKSTFTAVVHVYASGYINYSRAIVDREPRGGGQPSWKAN